MESWGNSDEETPIRRPLTRSESRRRLEAMARDAEGRTDRHRASLPAAEGSPHDTSQEHPGRVPRLRTRVALLSSPVHTVAMPGPSSSYQPESPGSASDENEYYCSVVLTKKPHLERATVVKYKRVGRRDRPVATNEEPSSRQWTLIRNPITPSDKSLKCNICSRGGRKHSFVYVCQCCDNKQVAHGMCLQRAYNSGDISICPTCGRLLTDPQVQIPMQQEEHRVEVLEFPEDAQDAQDAQKEIWWFLFVPSVRNRIVGAIVIILVCCATLYLFNFYYKSQTKEN